MGSRCPRAGCLLQRDRSRDDGSGRLCVPPALTHVSVVIIWAVVVWWGVVAGIGLALASQLALQGHELILACRSEVKCEAARASVARSCQLAEEDWRGSSTNPHSRVHVHPPSGAHHRRNGRPIVLRPSRAADGRGAGADDDDASWPCPGPVVLAPGLELQSLGSVKRWVEAVVVPRLAGRQLDALFANAGFTPSPTRAEDEGPEGGALEAGLAAMHLGHMALTEWLVRRGLLHARNGGVVAYSAAAAAAEAAADEEEEEQQQQQQEEEDALGGRRVGHASVVRACVRACVRAQSLSSTCRVRLSCQR
jgi:NAD(P)-dependent dehydrogenase (short-subunit alcohol dehydrogenase family)